MALPFPAMSEPYPPRCPPERLALPDDVLGRLVPPKTLEPRMSELPVAGPLGERDLRHQLRFHPARPSRDVGVVERRIAALELAEAPAQVAKDLLRVTRSDLPGIAEPAILVVADDERTELRSR